MRHFISRDNLMDMLGECPRRQVQRAVLSGRIESLGLFSRIAPDVPYPAWMFVVNERYNVAALMKENGKVGFRILKEVPWEYWNTDNKRGIAEGDNPILYLLKRCKHETVS